MTELPQIGHYEYLDFNSPLSSVRADSIAAALAVGEPQSILDAGCGWGELLIRLVTASDSASGVGMDDDTVSLERGRANASRAGLSERVAFVEGNIADLTQTADVIICIGADHAFGDQADALNALYKLVNPGGRLLLGTGFWEHDPSDEQAAILGMTPGSLSHLDGLVDTTIAAGFRPLSVQTANTDEWNDFESGYLADYETWLLRNPADPSAEAVRHKADTHRKQWLSGYRGVLGFAYLILGAPAPTRGTGS
jgi:ubiquinone/menaquinone biosynthesis C-methylase UbiE